MLAYHSRPGVRCVSLANHKINSREDGAEDTGEIRDIMGVVKSSEKRVDGESVVMGKVEMDRWHGISGKATVAQASANETVGAKIPKGSAATTLSLETLGNSTNSVARPQESFDI